MNYFLISKTMYDAEQHVEFDTLISVHPSSFSANNKIEKLQKELIDDGFERFRRARGTIFVKKNIQVQFNCVEVPFSV